MKNEGKKKNLQNHIEMNQSKRGTHRQKTIYRNQQQQKEKKTRFKNNFD